MAKEIECKIMGMGPDEFIALADDKGVEIRRGSSPSILKDIYWELPNIKLIRHRCILFDEGKQSRLNQDITVKSCERNSGDEISEREEIILSLTENSDVEGFLNVIGATKKHFVSKKRVLLHLHPYSDMGVINIHYDEIIKSDLKWIEIESDNNETLVAFLDKLGIKETSNKKTLELIKEK